MKGCKIKKKKKDDDEVVEEMGHKAKEPSKARDNTISKETLKSRKNLKPASLEDNKVNYQGTIEAAYDNLDKILDSGAISKMTTDTNNLMDRQTKLASQIEKFVPIVEKAEGMLSKLPMEKMTSMIEKLGGMGVVPKA